MTQSRPACTPTPIPQRFRQHGGRPFWAAYTFALAYWTQDDTARALAWYDAAFASNTDWGTEAGMEGKTRHWRPEQRERMRGLFEAWVETGVRVHSDPGLPG